jgi:hypothetical protein
MAPRKMAQTIAVRREGEEIREDFERLVGTAGGLRIQVNQVSDSMHEKH